jgi:anti-anti-sigma regulatory factor
MNISVEQGHGRVTVTIVRLDGELDASNYEALIGRTRELFDAGSRDILLDLRGVSYMGSSGLVAIHAVALLFEGEQLPDFESGWEAHHAIARSVESGRAQEHTKLLASADPANSVRRVLSRTGMDRFIPVETDEAAAVASF